jgi:N6-L-threonylcarbamoyladenine synthase
MVIQRKNNFSQSSQIQKGKNLRIIIGIESTAHTFGVGVVKNGKVLSNVRDMYTTKEGGIIPMESAKHHVEVAEKVWSKGLEEAGINEKDVDGIAISRAPGLAPCLIEGMKFAKKKCRELGVGLICVNHCVAHLEIGKLTGAKDPVLLYASGANTQVIAFSGGKYRVFGETLDIGIGNFIDNFARVIGQGFPGGPKVQELAVKGKYVELPYSIKGMDVAFSGMLTKLRQMYSSGNFRIEDLCFSLQETAFAMLVEASERALAHTGKKELLLGGGVGCNSRLQEMCKIMCEERGCKFFVPSRDLLIDNGGMIAYLGWLMFKKGLVVDVSKLDDVDIDPKERTDMVDVKWK